jgi:pheromone shutdown protein TraB
MSGATIGVASATSTPFVQPAVLLVGVAHVLDLEKGLDRVLGAFHPQALAVELDAERARLLQERVAEKAQGGSGERPGRGASGAPMLLRLWAHLQDRFAADMGGVPGEEMLQAAAFARERNLPCFLVDDALSQVAPRLLSSLSGKEKVRLLVSTAIALVIPTRMVQGGIDEYSAHRDEYLGAMRQQYPTLTRVLLDERNLHMAARIQSLAQRYGRVAAVVGDAHVAGLSQVLAAGGVGVERAHLETVVQEEGATRAPSAPTAP